MKESKDKGFSLEINCDSEFKSYNLTYTQKKDIKAKLAEELRQEKEVEFAFLHGSFLKNKSFRDIDIAVYLSDDLSYDKNLDFCNRLSVKLTYKVGFPIDVNFLNNASLGFCYHAVQGEILTYQQLEEVYEFKEDIFIKYMDFYPFIKENLADLLT